MGYAVGTMLIAGIVEYQRDDSRQAQRCNFVEQFAKCLLIDHCGIAHRYKLMRYRIPCAEHIESLAA